MPKNLVFLAVDFDFRAAIFGDEDAVADFDFEGDPCRSSSGFAGAEGADDAHLVFFGGIGDDDATLLFSFDGSTRMRSPRV